MDAAYVKELGGKITEESGGKNGGLAHAGAAGLTRSGDPDERRNGGSGSDRAKDFRTRE
jgi:hypothetical protein